MKRMKNIFVAAALALAAAGTSIPVSANPFGISISEDGTITAEGDITIGGVTIGVDGLQVTPEDIENGINYLMEEFKTGDGLALPSPERGSSLAEDALGELAKLLEGGKISITLPDFEDTEDPLPEEGEEQVLDTSDSLILNQAATSYYYSVLNPEEQQMYQDMLTLAKFPEDTTLKIVESSALNPAEDPFYDEFCRAYFALVYDHAELFWLYTGNMDVQYWYDSTPGEDGTYEYYLALTGSYPEYQSQMTQFNQAVRECLAAIDQSKPQAEVAMQIHDYILNLATYDYPALDINQLDNSHTAYGILVSNDYGTAHTAVCEGYAYAYSYLLQQVGIDSMVIYGMAGGTAEDAGRHAWNLVGLDGQWYEVDPTWNDFEEQPNPQNSYYDIEVQALGDASFVNRQKHYLYNLTTAQIQNYTPDDRLTYYTADGGWVCYTGSSIHNRHTAETSMGISDDLSMLAPIANGTTYTYDYLMNL